MLCGRRWRPGRRQPCFTSTCWASATSGPRAAQAFKTKAAGLRAAFTLDSIAARSGFPQFWYKKQRSFVNVCIYWYICLALLTWVGRTRQTAEVEENPVHGRNTTVNADKIRGFRPLYVWTMTFVFFPITDRTSTDRRFCSVTLGTPCSTTVAVGLYHYLDCCILPFLMLLYDFQVLPPSLVKGYMSVTR